jgi:hypothetical protein
MEKRTPDHSTKNPANQPVAGFLQGEMMLIFI